MILYNGVSRLSSNMYPFKENIVNLDNIIARSWFSLLGF